MSVPGDLTLEARLIKGRLGEAVIEKKSSAMECLLIIVTFLGAFTVTLLFEASDADFESEVLYQIHLFALTFSSALGFSCMCLLVFIIIKIRRHLGSSLFMFGDSQSAKEMAEVHTPKLFEIFMNRGRDRKDMAGMPNKHDQHFEARCWYNITCGDLTTGKCADEHPDAGKKGHRKKGPTHKLPLVGKVSLNGRTLHRIAIYYFVGQMCLFILALGFVLEDKSPYTYPAILSIWTILIPGITFFIIYMAFDEPKTKGLSELL